MVGLARVRRLVARQAQVGALLTSSFGPRALRITTPDIGYEIPYASITHIRRSAMCSWSSPTTTS